MNYLVGCLDPLTDAPHSSPNSLLYFVTKFVSSFLSKCSACTRIEKVPILVKSLWILKPKSKVNPTPCRFAMFCSVNNLSNLSGTFPHLIIRVCSKTKLELSLSVINIGCLSNDDGEGNENVTSY